MPWAGPEEASCTVWVRGLRGTDEVTRTSLTVVHAVYGSTGIDLDCDGVIDIPLESDDDGDGYTASEGDCDDLDPTVAPDAPEEVNGWDDDCDGWIDDGTPVVDDDGDEYREVDGDCDDSDPDVWPGQRESFDGIDDDCDGRIDDVDDTGADSDSPVDTGVGSDSEGETADTDRDDSAADSDEVVRETDVVAETDAALETDPPLSDPTGVDAPHAAPSACGCSQGAQRPGFIWIILMVFVLGRRAGASGRRERPRRHSPGL